jgi:hypothetical protein
MWPHRKFARCELRARPTCYPSLLSCPAEIVNQTGYSNFRYAGWLLQRDRGDKWTVGTEIWYHGPEGPATPQTHSSTMIDVGGYYYICKPAFQLLFSIGHSAIGQSETYAYFGLYWTWGTKELDSAAHPVAWSTAGPRLSR